MTPTRPDAPLSVLYVIPGLGSGGGAERSLLDLAPGYRAEGISLSVCYFHDRPTSAVDAFHEAGVPTRKLDERSLLGRIRALRRMVRAERPDIVHTTLFQADLIGRLACIGLPTRVLSSLVTSSYGPERRADPTYSWWRVQLVRWSEIVTLRWCCDHVHANSQSVRQAAIRDLHADPTRVTVVYRGRDPQVHQRPTPEQVAAVRQELAPRPGARLAVAVARHEYQKDLLTLVEAARIAASAHPELVVAIAGREGSMTERVEEAIRAAGPDQPVRLLGHRSDVTVLLAAADLFAFTSTVEGLPGAIIEAMAMGLPIVATAIGPVTELLGHDSALLAAPGDPGSIAEAIIEVLDAPDEARQRAQVATDRYLARFTTEESLRGMVGLYRTLAHPDQRGVQA